MLEKDDLAKFNILVKSFMDNDMDIKYSDENIFNPLYNYNQSISCVFSHLHKKINQLLEDCKERVYTNHNKYLTVDLRKRATDYLKK